MSDFNSNMDNAQRILESDTDNQASNQVFRENTREKENCSAQQQPFQYTLCWLSCRR